jgi:hypothetical protein
MAKLSAAGPLEASSSTIIPTDPAMLAMAVALYSIEQKLDSILEMEKQILSFLENEKESQIEADVKILAESITQYKYNWKKDLYLQGHYKQALDIKRTAEKNIRSYQKDIQDWNVANAPIVMNAKVNAGVKILLKKFKYYRLSLYIYSLASLVEVMMLKDFQEEHLNRIKKDIEDRSLAYRELYTERSKQIGKAAGGALEANVLKNMGNVGKVFGGFIGGIPFVKEGPVDEWLQDGGSALSKNAENMETDPVKMLAAVKDPGTKVFVEKIDDLNRIYNHTSEICFDKDKIYLVAK